MAAKKKNKKNLSLLATAAAAGALVGAAATVLADPKKRKDLEKGVGKLKKKADKELKQAKKALKS